MMSLFYRNALIIYLCFERTSGLPVRRKSCVQAATPSCIGGAFHPLHRQHDPPGFVTSMMVSGTINRQEVELPSGRFMACWPVGLGTYNGRAAVFLASGRRILDPRDEVLPVPIAEEAVALLAEASEFDDKIMGPTIVLVGNENGMIYWPAQVKRFHDDWRWLPRECTRCPTIYLQYTKLFDFVCTTWRLMYYILSKDVYLFWSSPQPGLPVPCPPTPYRLRRNAVLPGICLRWTM